MSAVILRAMRAIPMYFSHFPLVGIPSLFGRVSLVEFMNVALRIASYVLRVKRGRGPKPITRNYLYKTFNSLRK